jgi:hypothetical protein
MATLIAGAALDWEHKDYAPYVRNTVALMLSDHRLELAIAWVISTFLEAPDDETLLQAERTAGLPERLPVFRRVVDTCYSLPQDTVNDVRGALVEWYAFSKVPEGVKHVTAQDDAGRIIDHPEIEEAVNAGLQTGHDLDVGRLGTSKAYAIECKANAKRFLASATTNRRNQRKLEYMQLVKLALTSVSVYLFCFVTWNSTFENEIVQRLATRWPGVDRLNLASLSELCASES